MYLAEALRAFKNGNDPKHWQKTEEMLRFGEMCAPVAPDTLWTRLCGRESGGRVSCDLHSGGRAF